MINRIVISIAFFVLATVMVVTWLFMPNNSQDNLTIPVQQTTTDLAQHEKEVEELIEAYSENCDRLMDHGSSDYDDSIANAIVKHTKKVIDSQEPSKKYRDRLLTDNEQLVDPTEYDPALTDSLLDGFEAEEHRFIKWELDKALGRLI